MKLTLLTLALSLAQPAVDPLTELEPGTVVGNVVDAQGAPLLGPLAMRAYCLPRSADEAGEADAAQRSLPVTVSGTAFRVTGVPAGRVWLYADSELYGKQVLPGIEVEPGATRAADLVYAVDQRRVLDVVLEHDPAFPHLRTGDVVRVMRDGRIVDVGRKLEAGHCRYVFDDLEPGRYTLVANTRCGYDDATWEGVRTGQSSTLRMRAPSALDLTVVEAGTDLELTRYSLRVVLPAWARSGDAIVLREPGSAAPADGFYPEVPYGLPKLAIAAPGYCDELVTMPWIPIGGTRVMTVELAPSRRLLGSVIDTEGRGVGGAEVSLIPRSEQLLGPTRRNRDWIKGLSTKTDERGRFAFEGLRDGSYALAGVHPRLALEARATLDVGPETPAAVLRLPPVGTLHGRLLGTLPASATVEADPLDVRGRATAAELAQDGSFSFSELPAGRIQLWIVTADGQGHSTKRLLEVVELAPGVNGRVIPVD